MRGEKMTWQPSASGLPRRVPPRNDGQLQFEASGGITLENIKQYATTGVDSISCGILTNNAPALDLSLRLQN